MVEVDENGEVVLRIDVPTPYEAERLGTGDESATGWSNTKLAGGTHNLTNADPAGRARHAGLERIIAFVNGPMINGFLYVAPTWMTVRGLIATLVLGVTTLTWLGFELRWSTASLPSLDELY